MSPDATYADDTTTHKRDRRALDNELPTQRVFVPCRNALVDLDPTPTARVERRTGDSGATVRILALDTSPESADDELPPETVRDPRRPPQPSRPSPSDVRVVASPFDPAGVTYLETFLVEQARRSSAHLLAAEVARRSSSQIPAAPQARVTARHGSSSSLHTARHPSSPSLPAARPTSSPSLPAVAARPQSSPSYPSLPSLQGLSAHEMHAIAARENVLAALASLPSIPSYAPTDTNSDPHLRRVPSSVLPTNVVRPIPPPRRRASLVLVSLALLVAIFAAVFVFFLDGRIASAAPAQRAVARFVESHAAEHALKERNEKGPAPAPARVVYRCPAPPSALAALPASDASSSDATPEVTSAKAPEALDLSKRDLLSEAL